LFDPLRQGTALPRPGSALIEEKRKGAGKGRKEDQGGDRRSQKKVKVKK